jgi:DNA-binding NarL/FixJ family response regulator
MEPNEAHGLTGVVADDHPVVGDAVRAVLTAHGIEVVALASDGEEALELVARERPLIALVDMGLPGADGAEVARRTAGISPETAVIVFTGRSDFAVLIEALDAGARGFVLKEAPLPDLVRAIEMVAQIGTHLFISPQTVRTHVGKAMEKLDVHSRTEAVAVALRQKLIA